MGLKILLRVKLNGLIGSDQGSCGHRVQDAFWPNQEPVYTVKINDLGSLFVPGQNPWLPHQAILSLDKKWTKVINFNCKDRSLIGSDQVLWKTMVWGH